MGNYSSDNRGASYLDAALMVFGALAIGMAMSVQGASYVDSKKCDVVV